MATITVFYALHCQEEQFLTRLQEKTQYKLVRDAEVIARAEQLFQRWGTGLVLIGRMIPAIRTLISIPAIVSVMSNY